MSACNLLRTTALVFVSAIGCSGTDDLAVSVDQAPALGAVSYGSDCSSDLTSFLDQAMRYGRVAVATPAFRECMTAAVHGTPLYIPVRGRTIPLYRQCIGDPGYGLTPDEQLAAALMMAHNEHDVLMNCTGGFDIASTIRPTSPNQLWWSDWLKEAYAQRAMPLCDPRSASSSGCRFAPDPWPTSQAASTAWAAFSISEGYTQGAQGPGTEDPTAARTACGYAGDTTWNFKENTMPYVIGWCVEDVIDQSAVTCDGGLAGGCDSGSLRMIDSFSGATCSCVHDPRAEGLSFVHVSADQLKSYEIVDEGDWMGGWHYGSGDIIVATGDFDNDGRSDFVIRSGWGLGIVKRNAGGGFTTLAAVPWGTTISGRYTLLATDTILGVGDFDGTPQDDLLIKAGAGLVILEMVGSLSAVDLIPWSTSSTGWPHATDRFAGSGDFDGDGISDLVLQDSSRLALAHVIRSSPFSGIIPYSDVSAGGFMGSWQYGGTDQILGVGDFDGNARSDFLIKSAWGIGTITRDSTGSLRHLKMVPFGGTWGGWPTSATDLLVGIGDINGDHRADLIWRSTWGLGITSHSTTGAAMALSGFRYGTQVTGTWRFGSGDTFPALGDFTGDGRLDLVLRGSWGVALLAGASSGQVSPTMTYPLFDLMGSWQVRPEDRFMPVGDFDGDGRQDLFIQR